MKNNIMNCEPNDLMSIKSKDTRPMWIKDALDGLCYSIEESGKKDLFQVKAMCLESNKKDIEKRIKMDLKKGKLAIKKEPVLALNVIREKEYLLNMIIQDLLKNSSNIPRELLVSCVERIRYVLSMDEYVYSADLLDRNREFLLNLVLFYSRRFLLNHGACLVNFDGSYVSKIHKFVFLCDSVLESQDPQYIEDRLKTTSGETTLGDDIVLLAFEIFASKHSHKVSVRAA